MQKKSIKKNILLSSNFVLATIIQIIALMLAIRFLKNPVFGTNDDLYMASLLQGNLLGETGGHSYYIGPIFSSLIAVFSKSFNSYSWYSILLLAFTMLAFSYLLHSLLRNVTHTVSKIYLFVFWFTISLTSVMYNYLQPTFTSVSIITVGIGVITFFLNYLKRSELRQYSVIVPLIIITLSISLRRESAVLAIMMALLITIYLILMKISQYKFHLRSLVPLLSTIVIVFIVENYLYQKLLEVEWSSYYNLASFVDRLQPLDNRYLKEEYYSISYTNSDSEIISEDLKMFENFIIFDDSFYSVENFQFIDSQINSGSLRSFEYFLLNFRMENFIVQIMQQYKFILTVMLFLVLLFILFTTNINRLGILSFICLIISVHLLVLNFLFISFKLPERVYFSIFILLALNVIFIVAERLSEKNVYFKNSMIPLFLLIISLLFFVQEGKKEFVARDSYYFEMKKNTKYQYQRYKSIDSSGIFTGSLSALNINWINPYDKNLLSKRLSNIILLGWFSTSPNWKEHVSNSNADPDNFSDSLLYQNLYFVIDNDLIDVVQKKLENETKKTLLTETFDLSQQTSIVKYIAN